MTVHQMYEQTIKPLSMADRLRLAALILNDIPPHAVVDYSPSAFRAYLGMATPTAVHVIGHLSTRDWGSVQTCLMRALAIPAPPSP